MVVILFVCAWGKEIWMVRHCDKPTSGDSDCCSSEGYARSTGWADYFKERIDISSTGFVSSTYKESSPSCVSGLAPENTSSKCQGSQRMFLTSSYLAEGMHYSGSINTDYCTGKSSDASNVASYMSKQKETQLLVWNHEQIPDVINALGINLSAWPSDLDDVYNIVFRVSGGDLQYNCYDFKTDTINCVSGVDKWLADYKKIA